MLENYRTSINVNNKTTTKWTTIQQQNGSLETQKKRIFLGIHFGIDRTGHCLQGCIVPH